MDWRDDVAAEMPPPNEDEPASLRRDILDELSDHLACAAHRERIHEPDENTVRQTILNRFGDPAKLARRLWFDAMKGKLMLQKLTAAFAATAALAAIAVCLVLWSAVSAATAAFETAVEQSRKDRERADEQSRDDRKRADKANAALLAQLKAIAGDAKKTNVRSLEWNPLKFKLLRGQNGTRPAVGYTVSLQGQPYKGGEKDYLSKTSDVNGVVDFGRVRPGSYTVGVSTPWESRTTLFIKVTPGSEVEKTIRCPETAIVDTELELTVDLPEDLVKRKCRVAMQMWGPVQNLGGDSWSLPRGGSGMSNGGTHYEFTATNNPHILKEWSRVAESRIPSTSLGFLGMQFRQSRNQYHEGKLAFGWRTGEYRIQWVALLFPDERVKARLSTAGRGRFGGNRPDYLHVVDAVSYGGGMVFPGGSVEQKSLTFTPQAGKNNVWKITLPPKMLANARERLKRYDAQLKRAQEKSKPGSGKKPKAAAARKPVGGLLGSTELTGNWRVRKAAFLPEEPRLRADGTKGTGHGFHANGAKSFHPQPSSRSAIESSATIRLIRSIRGQKKT